MERMFGGRYSPKCRFKRLKKKKYTGSGTGDDEGQTQVRGRSTVWTISSGYAGHKTTTRTDKDTQETHKKGNMRREPEAAAAKADIEWGLNGD
jgi:hypothetical protein